MYRWRRWFGRTATAADTARQRWHSAWAEAAGAPTREQVDRLRQQLSALALPADEIELEQEMLDGLVAVIELASAAVPMLETGHRAIGTEACHFSAPASMPDEPSQPGGRLLFTPSRAVFVGGGTAATIPWHGVGDVRQSARDVLLVHRERVSRFRTNSYADALCAAHLARRLAALRRGAACQ